jgi:predicted DNA-binding antitoxin AbrB/MazE fold protein
MNIPAKYENGVFRPLDVVKIKEGTLVYVHVPQEEKVKPRSIRDLGFAGMWEYRDDIIDGLSYVNSLRDNPRE